MRGTRLWALLLLASVLRAETVRQQIPLEHARAADLAALFGLPPSVSGDAGVYRSGPAPDPGCFVMALPPGITDFHAIERGLYREGAAVCLEGEPDAVAALAGLVRSLDVAPTTVRLRVECLRLPLATAPSWLGPTAPAVTTHILHEPAEVVWLRALAEPGEVVCQADSTNAAPVTLDVPATATEDGRSLLACTRLVLHGRRLGDRAVVHVRVAQGRVFAATQAEGRGLAGLTQCEPLIDLSALERLGPRDALVVAVGRGVLPAPADPRWGRLPLLGTCLRDEPTREVLVVTARILP